MKISMEAIIRANERLIQDGAISQNISPEGMTINYTHYGKDHSKYISREK